MIKTITSHKIKKVQRGVALIQVLLISSLISILAISFSFTARNQVKMARAFEQRTSATQLLKSVQNKVIYTLLTQNIFDKSINVFPESERWNFYGQPFVLEQSKDVKIIAQIQDNSGLLSQQLIHTPMWNKVFKGLGLSEEQIKQKQGEISDWQDQDTNSWIIGSKELSTLNNGQLYRNQPIQLSQEIAWFFSQEPKIINLIQAISTHLLSIRFNPMNAPAPLLRLLLEQDVADEIIRLRSNNTLTAQEMITMLGNSFDSDYMYLYRGSNLKITIYVELNTVQLQETIEIKLQPDKTLPIIILSRY